MTYSIPQTRQWNLSIPKSVSRPQWQPWQRFRRLSYDLGIDLGTSSTRICIPDQGVVIQEPSMLAFSPDTQQLLAFGTTARQMLGRTSDVEIKQPVLRGVVADFELTQLMLQHLIQKAQGNASIFRPRIVVGNPGRATQVERWALIDTVLQAGAREVSLIDEPVAAAIGAGLPLVEPTGNLIVDIGGGKTEVAVVNSLGTIVSELITVAGDTLDQAIIDFLHHHHELRVGALTAENIKIKQGLAYPSPQQDKQTFTVSGLRLRTGLTDYVSIKRGELREVLASPLSAIVDAIKSVIGRMSPDLVNDVCDRGIILTGGGALLPGLDKLIAQQVGLMVHLADNPLNSIALGAGTTLQHHQYQNVLAAVSQ